MMCKIKTKHLKTDRTLLDKVSSREWVTLSPKEKQLVNRARLIKNRQDATEYELRFRRKLDKWNIRHIWQKGFWGKGNADRQYCYAIVDFYFPKSKLCVEIDGGYHKKRIGYDKWRDKYLTLDRGLSVLRIKNEDVEAFDIKELLSHGVVFKK